MERALKEIDRLNQQLQQLEIAAEQAQALKADVDSQIQMFEQRLKPLNEALLISAPEGMALTSGEHMQTAAKNVAINAGGDISIGVMGNMTRWRRKAGAVCPHRATEPEIGRAGRCPGAKRQYAVVC
jgi:type VI secretion system secreted protein VgrG